MNAANIITLLFCLATAGVTYVIFSECWQTPYGARIPFRRIQQKWMLTFPVSFALLGMFSFLTSGWENPIETLPKWLAISVCITTGLCLIRWYRSKDPMQVPIDIVIKHYWPQAQRFEPAQYAQQANIQNELLKCRDIFTITNVSGLEILLVYMRYVKSLGQTLIGDPNIEVTDGSTIYQFRSEEKTPAEVFTYEHQILCIVNPPMVSFHSKII